MSVGFDHGNFALSIFLDVIEMMRIFDIEEFKKINVDLELTPFFLLLLY